MYTPSGPGTSSCSAACALPTPTAWWRIRTVTCCCTRCAMRCWGPPGSGTSASTSATPTRAAIARQVAQLLGVNETRVNLKATTTEGLGFLGRCEGIAAHAAVLLDEG